MANTLPIVVIAKRDSAPNAGGSVPARRISTQPGFPTLPAPSASAEGHGVMSAETGVSKETRSVTVVPPGEPDRQALKQEVRKLSGQIESLQSQTTFLASILEATSDAMIVAENDGTVTIFNGGAAQLFGIPVGEAAGLNLFWLLEQALIDNAGTEAAKLLMSEGRVVNFRAEIVATTMKRTSVLLTLNFVPSGKRPAIVAVLKDNSEVEALTRTDPLTGLANRREFDRKIRDEYVRFKRGHMTELSLIMLDVDWFRDFNTSYGHQVGDDVLRKVGDVLRSCVREIDTAARYGGEEFAVILPGTGESGTLVVAERIRATLETSVIHDARHGNLKVTASLGVCTHRPKHESPASLIAQADKALYAAKNGGRNQTCRFVTGQMK